MSDLTTYAAVGSGVLVTVWLWRAFRPGWHWPNADELESGFTSPDGRWEVRVSDSQMVDDPADAMVEDRFDDRSDARRAAMRISRARDLAFGVWDRETEQFVAPFEEVNTP